MTDTSEARKSRRLPPAKRALSLALLAGCWIERPPLESPASPPAAAEAAATPVAASAAVIEGDTTLDPGAIASAVGAVEGPLAACLGGSGRLDLIVRVDAGGRAEEVHREELGVPGVFSQDPASSPDACLLDALRSAPLPRPSTPTIFRTSLWVEGAAAVPPQAGAADHAASLPTSTRRDVFLVTIAAARLDPARPDGRAWDDGRGAGPDVVVRLVRNDETVLTAGPVGDSAAPVFDVEAGRSLRLGPADQVVFELYDDDPAPAGPELLCRFQVPAPGPSDLERGTWEIGSFPPMQRLSIRLEPPRSLVGTGIRWGRRRGGALGVLEVALDSPAALAGVAAGDRILAVDGQRTRGLALPALESLFHGEVGTRLRLEIEGRSGHREVELERSIVFY